MLLPRLLSSLQHSATEYPGCHYHSHVNLLPQFQSDFDAAWVLSLSSTLGIVADRRRFLGGSAGTVITLLSASLLSNSGFAPHSHKLYDICWSRLLPATLALTLLNNTHYGSVNDENQIVHPLTRKIYSSVFTSFLIASAGSILGCIVAASWFCNPLTCNFLRGLQMPVKDVVLTAGL